MLCCRANKQDPVACYKQRSSKACKCARKLHSEAESATHPELLRPHQTTQSTAPPLPPAWQRSAGLRGAGGRAMLVPSAPACAAAGASFRPIAGSNHHPSLQVGHGPQAVARTSRGHHIVVHARPLHMVQPVEAKVPLCLVQLQARQPGAAGRAGGRGGCDGQS